MLVHTIHPEYIQGLDTGHTMGLQEQSTMNPNRIL